MEVETNKRHLPKVSYYVSFLTSIQNWSSQIWKRDIIHALLYSRPTRIKRLIIFWIIKLLQYPRN
jgi:hypothetical protein